MAKVYDTMPHVLFLPYPHFVLAEDFEHVTEAFSHMADVISHSFG